MPYLALFFLLLVGPVANAQVCGTPYEGMQERIQTHVRHLRDFGPAHSRVIQYVPINFHAFAQNDGDDRVSLRDLSDMMCYVNQEYADMEIEFYINKLNLVDNTGGYNGTAQGLYTSLANSNRDGVNIFLVDKADTNSDIGVTLGYYNPNNDVIVMRDEEISANNNTLVHELGHFFSLPHPHNGWDAEPYNVDEHGVQVSAFSPGGVLNEKQDGSNCAIAGDFICDTPPDYNFGLGNVGCLFTEEVLDPDGEQVDPEELLHMGYFLNGCELDEYFFSDMQQDIVLNDLASNARNYLDNNFTPSTTAVAAPTLTSPAAGEVVEGFDGVTLEWESAGADIFIVRYALFSNLNSGEARIVFGNSVTLTDLLPDRNYFWEVRALSRSQFCAENVISEKQNFRTGLSSAVRDVAGLSDWQVSPNPVETDAPLFLSLTAEQAFTGRAQLVDLAGRVRHEQALQVTPGTQRIALSTAALSPGIYFAVLRDARGVSRRRVLVR